MASVWGASWGNAWGNAWGAITQQEAPAAETGGWGAGIFRRPKRKEEKEEAHQVIEQVAQVAQPVAEAQKELKTALEDRGIEYRLEYLKALLRITRQIEAERQRKAKRERESIELLLLA